MASGPSGMRASLPPKVLSHPLLQRLAPDLRERVLQQLQHLALRNPGAGGGGFGGGGKAPGARSVNWGPAAGGQASGDWVTDAVAPPPNHSHAGAQTTFPSDAAVQTDHVMPSDRASADGQSLFTPQATPKTATRSIAADTALIPPGHFTGGDLPPFATYQDAKAHAQSILHSQGHPDAPPDLSSPYASGAVQPTSPYYTGGGDLQAEVHSEFWRHYNTAYNTAVTQAKDLDVDSLLHEVDPYVLGDDAPYGRYDTAQDFADVHDPSGVRRAVRKDTHDIFWQEYTQSLGSMLPGAAAGGPRDGAGRSPFAAPSRDPGFSSYLSHDSFGNYDPPVYESVNNPNPVPHRQAFNSL